MHLNTARSNSWGPRLWGNFCMDMKLNMPIDAYEAKAAESSCELSNNFGNPMRTSSPQHLCRVRDDCLEAARSSTVTPRDGKAAAEHIAKRGCGDGIDGNEPAQEAAREAEALEEEREGRMRQPPRSSGDEHRVEGAEGAGEASADGLALLPLRLS